MSSPEIVIITDSAEKPITLLQVKAWLRIDGSAEDDKLNMLIDSAISTLEAYLCRPIIDKVILYKRSNLLQDITAEYISLPFPVKSVSFCKIYDTTNTENTITYSNYRNKIIVNQNNIKARDYHAYQVQFTSGIATNATTCPNDIKSVLLEIISKQYSGCCEIPWTQVMSAVSHYIFHEMEAFE